MSYMTEITARIGELDRRQRVILAGMCAASIFPVVTRFAQPTTIEAFERGLSAIWKSAQEGDSDSHVRSMRAKLNDLSESTCDDSNIPAYEVMIALSILAYALDAAIEDDSAGRARMACTTASNYCGGYDHILTHGIKPIKIDPRNPPPPGLMESLQIQC